jgi:hypothetical protein
VATRSPWSSSYRACRPSRIDRLHQHRDDGSSPKTKWDMAKDSEYRSKLSGVARNRDDGALVRREDVVKDGFGTQVLSDWRFSRDAIEERVKLYEAVFDLVGRIGRMNPGLVTPAVARVEANSFAKIFLYRRHEFVLSQIESAEGDVGRAQTARQRASVERLRSRDLLKLDSTSPEVVSNLRLSDSIGCEFGIFLEGLSMNTVSCFNWPRLLTQDAVPLPSINDQ